MKRDTNGVPNLTAREAEIVRLVWDGLTNLQIAKRLKRHVKTIESHRANVMKKYRTTNTAQMLRIALHERVIS